ncbi:hypothetical protein ANN_01489 [Periplaneta americana]|uniref:Uncharacterized protein n=1 Tax=Periplaneta americana TaxID=6978 RepID=A0ABQ8TVG7_PERAM|nr:hypothetical protein ANN_01489 [Periplaneta americana]
MENMMKMNYGKNTWKKKSNSDFIDYYKYYLEDVKQAIQLMKSNRVPGEDGMPTELFKYAGEELSSHILSRIF